MIYIAHRGNIRGPNPDQENHPDYLKTAIKEGYQVEVDVWFLDGVFILGHDHPQYEVHKSFFSNKNFWVHAKDIKTLHALMTHGNLVHCFFHDKDDCTLTSRGWIWTYPGKQVFPNSVIVQKGLEAIPLCYGVCTDYPLSFQD